jgi:hypothetical protein
VGVIWLEGSQHSENGGKVMDVLRYIFLIGGGLVILYIATRLVASAVLRTIHDFRKDR